ncbi:MAG TPA: TonB family protein [Blastocatellia bacterium]
MRQVTRTLPLLSATIILLFASVAGAAGAILFMPARVVQQSGSSLEEHLTKSRQASAAKDYKVARNEAREALKLNKHSPEANLLLALASKHLQRSEDAMKYVKKAIEYLQNYADAHYLLAVLLYEKREMKKAASELETAMSLGARFPNAYVLKGMLELQSSQQEAALNSYKEALRLAGHDDAELASLKERVTALEAIQEHLTHKGDAAYQRPQLLNRPMPRYTEEARRNHIQGAVRAAMLIDEQGNVTRVVVLTTLGYGLDEQAVQAASRLKFSPATKDGKPVPFWLMVMIEFNLR